MGFKGLINQLRGWLIILYHPICLIYICYILHVGPYVAIAMGLAKIMASTQLMYV